VSYQDISKYQKASLELAMQNRNEKVCHSGCRSVTKLILTWRGIRFEK